MPLPFCISRRVAAAIVLTTLLPACRGSAPVLPTNPPAAALSGRAKGVAAFVISDYFPKSDARRPHYFPVDTHQLLIRIGDTQTQIALTPLSPQCSLGPSHIKCVVKVTTAQGRDSYTVTAVDAYGQRLSTAAGTANVGTQTDIPLTLHGIPVTVAATLTATPIVGRSSTIALDVSAFDADGKLIVGAATYDKPLELANADSTGVFRLSADEVTGPQSTIALRYNGGLANTSISVKPSDSTAKAAFSVYPELSIKTFHIGRGRFGGTFLVPGSLTRGTHGDMAVAYAHGFATISPTGKVSHHSSHLSINGLTVGPDGAYWMGRSKCDFPASDCKASYVSRYEGTYRNFAVSDAVTSVVSGPDHKLWALSSNPEMVYAVETTGSVQTYAVPNTISLRTSNLVAPADGNVWFYDRGGAIGSSSDRFVVVAPDGSMASIAVHGSDPGALALSPDRKTIWVPESFYGGIGYMDVPTRKFRTIPNVPIQFTGSVIPTAVSTKGVWLQVQRPPYASPKDPFIAFLRPDGTRVDVEMPGSSAVTEISSLCFAADGKLWFATDTAVGTIALGK